MCIPTLRRRTFPRCTSSPRGRRLRFESGADDVNDLAWPNFAGGCVQLLKDRLKAVQAIVWDAGHDEPEPEFAEVILGFQLAVNRYEPAFPF